MRRAVFIALMISLIALSACAGGGANEKEKFLDIRARYIGASDITILADMTADYGDRVYNYKLSYKGNGTRGEITVTEPAKIEGLVALVDGNEVSLKYDGALLETGAILAGSVSPVEAFPLMIDAWKNGFIVSSWRESLGGQDCIAADIDITLAGDGDKTLHRAWFDAKSGMPLRAEFSVNGYTVIQCSFIETVVT